MVDTKLDEHVTRPLTKRNGRLFRPEVFRAKKRDLYGDAFISTPVSFKLITMIIASILLAAAVVLFTGSYKRTEKVIGHLVPSTGTIKVYAQQTGALDTIFVKEGDDVYAGQILLTVKRSRTNLGGQSVSDVFKSNIFQRKNNLEKQISSRVEKLEGDKNDLKNSIKAMTAELEILNSQLEIQVEQSKAAHQSFNRAMLLADDGYIAITEVERRKEIWFSQKRRTNLQKLDIDKVVHELEKLETDLLKISIKNDSIVSNLKNELLGLKFQEEDFSQDLGYSIKSPISGKVISVNVRSTGQSISQQELILSILPEDSKLVAEIYVPSRSIGFVEEGQTVRLLYSAFPYQRFGSYDATIEEVTKLIFSPSELKTPFELREPVYRVTAAPEFQNINMSDQQIPLRPGMQLQANIIIDEYPFFDWIMGPIRAVRGRS